MRAPSLEQALAHVTLSEKSTIALDVAGTLNLVDRTDWSATGKVFLNDVTYKATRFHHLSTNYKIAPDKAEFFQVDAIYLNQMKKMTKDSDLIIHTACIFT